jgi:nicotinamidase-related amidase
MRHPFIVSRENTALAIIDVQERLAATMKDKDQVVHNIKLLIQAARLFNIPILVTEQYPKGLGRTVPEITVEIPKITPIEKMTFSCCQADAFNKELEDLKVDQIILTGMETHICVLQTALDALQDGYRVQVVEDAVCSRTRDRWETGLRQMEKAGVLITCTETVIFELLGKAGTEEFKTMLKALK